MSKKVLMLLVSILAVAMLAVPVMAKPTQGQKAAVTMTQIQAGQEPGDPYLTGPIIHNQFKGYYGVTIEIKDDEGAVVSTLVGDVVVDRKLVVVPQKQGLRWIFTDYYNITIDTVDDEAVVGGFEGNGQLIMDGVSFVPVLHCDRARANALFHGTGLFEGQTLNFNIPWTPYTMGPIVWDGYLLKP